MTRQNIFAANWKMHKTRAEAEDFIQALAPAVQGSQATVFVAPPSTALDATAQAAAGSNIAVGAQNMHDADNGAFTGEVSATMLLDAGARFVILGHSERRHVFAEDDAFINRKVLKAIETGLTAVFCVGETQEQRDAGETESVLRQQLEQGLEGLGSLEGVVVAYEPVWAIGTGKTATPALAQEAHAFCRQVLHNSFGGQADDVSILYGGSVKPDNVTNLMQEADIDGALVGGASLDATSFSQIINF